MKKPIDIAIKSFYNNNWTGENRDIRAMGEDTLSKPNGAVEDGVFSSDDDVSNNDHNGGDAMSSNSRISSGLTMIERKRALDLVNSDEVFRDLAFIRGESPEFLATYEDVIMSDILVPAMFPYRNREYTIENFIDNNGYQEILRKNGLLLEEPQFMLKVGFGTYLPSMNKFTKETVCLTAGGIYVLLSEIARVSPKTARVLNMIEGTSSEKIPPRFSDEWKAWVVRRFNTIKWDIKIGVTDYGDWGIILSPEAAGQTKGEEDK